MRRTIATIALIAATACAPQAPPPARDFHPTISRDQYGVPTIHGADDAEAAYGLALAHAEDNFRTIQLVILAARGKLGSELGEEGAKSDFLWHMLGVREAVANGYDRMPEDIRAVMEAYAAGLNEYGRAHPYEVINNARAVTGRDVAAGSALTLPLFWGFERVLGVVADPASHPCATREASAESVDWGSNAFAVSPRRSSDGHTRVIVNSHQPWAGGVAWYEAGVESDTGWRVHGGLFPGAPFPVLGTNGPLGWAATVNLPDLADIYRLRTDAQHGGQYFYDGEWRRFETRTIWLGVKMGIFTIPIPKTLRFTVYGPAFETADGWVAVRYAGMGEIRAIEQFYRMGKAHNFEEWRAAFDMHAIPSFNFLYGDETGRIAYLYNAILPRRAAGYDWSGCVPGDTSATLWPQNEYLQAPALIDPPSGWLYSSNGAPWSSTDASADMRPEQFPDAAPFIETYITNRGYRAVETLSPLARISDEQLLATKFDITTSTRSRQYAAIQTILAADSSNDEELRDIQVLLRTWDLRSDQESRAAALANLMFYPLYTARRIGEVEPDPVSSARSSAAYLRAHFGRLDPTWGEALRLRRGNVDLPLDGGPDTIRAIRWTPNADDGRLDADFGDGFMMVMDWAPDRSLSVRVIHQWGASDHPDSPHYSDQSAMFSRHEWRTLDFGNPH